MENPEDRQQVRAPRIYSVRTMNQYMQKTNVVEPHHESPCESLRESHMSDDWTACCQMGWLVFETDGFRIRSVFM